MASFTIELPSKKSVSFGVPTYRNRMEALQRFRPQAQEAGFALEELIAATMILTIDGQPVPHALEQDVIDRMADWSTLDMSYYLEVFMAIAFPDDVQKQRAQAVAKSLLEGKSPAIPATVKATPTPVIGVAV